MVDRPAAGSEQPADGLDDRLVLIRPDGPEIEKQGVVVDSGENGWNLITQSPRQVIRGCRGTAGGQELCRYHLDRDSAAPHLGFPVFNRYIDPCWQRFSQPARNPAGPPLQGMRLQRQHAVEWGAFLELFRNEKELQGGLHGGQGQLAAAEGAAQWILSYPLDPFRTPHDEPRLGSADELVAAEAGAGDAGPDAPADERLGLGPVSLAGDPRPNAPGGGAARCLDVGHAEGAANLDELAA